MMSVSSEKIEQARQLLLQEIYCEKTDTLHTRREAIKQLLAPLLAARESGMSFDAIATLFQKVGLTLSPKTLERYYYALKSDEELAKEARQHAEKIHKLRQELQARSLRARQEQANKLALQLAAKAQTGMTRQMVCGDEAAHDVAFSHNTAVKLSAPETETYALPPPNALNNEDEFHNPPPAHINHAAAKTIDEIADDSLANIERTVIQADLEVREQQRVFYATGEPFVGTLTKKQLHLLRTTGRVIATSSGKSSKDFVAMRAQI